MFFISAVTLTVAQGMINGLLFYANIIWAYQGEFLSLSVTQHDNQNSKDLFNHFMFLRVFIAWMNLNFGIHWCLAFAKGLDAVSKTLLQYIFPIYLWIIAGVIVISVWYSTKMTNLFQLETELFLSFLLCFLFLQLNF